VAESGDAGDHDRLYFVVFGAAIGARMGTSRESVRRLHRAGIDHLSLFTEI